MRVSLLVAVAENGVIGSDGHLPWRLSADLKRFKRLTMGHAILMGRRTFESIGRVLPGRTSIILTRNPQFNAAGCLTAADWSQALARVPTGCDAFVIGGRQIYELALPYVQRLDWTQVHAAVAGDVCFPAVDWSAWQLVDDEPHVADAQNEFPYSFRVFERRAR